MVDEAHYIKQLEERNWANAILGIAKDSVVRCVLTGTPIPKSYGDIVNLFDFLWPENKPIDNLSKHKFLVLKKKNKMKM